MASSLNQALASVLEHRPQLLADVPLARSQEGAALLDAMLKCGACAGRASFPPSSSSSYLLGALLECGVRLHYMHGL